MAGEWNGKPYGPHKSSDSKFDSCVRLMLIKPTHKNCIVCGIYLPVEEFPRRNKWHWICAECNKKVKLRQKLKRKYGVDINELKALLLSQNGKCCICSDAINYEDGSACTDHNHQTHEIRGVLCLTCNSGLGMFKDNVDFLANAITYLYTKKDTSWKLEFV